MVMGLPLLITFEVNQGKEKEYKREKCRKGIRNKKNEKDNMKRVEEKIKMVSKEKN